MTEAVIGESSPAVAAGIVYVGDMEGVLHAVNAADGKGLWTFKTGSEIKSSPVVVGDKVLIGSYDGNLYGVNVKTGKRMEFQTQAQVHATPAVDNGLAFIAGCDEHFRAVRIADGTQAYEVPRRPTRVHRRRS